MTVWHWVAIAVLALVGSWLALVAVWVAMALFSYIAGALGL
jgi:hypothetical protein